MSNSSMVSYVRLTSNCNSPRNQKITKIALHHAAGVISVEGMGDIINNPNREVSCNYCIGSDTRIGMYVEEKDRAWTTSSSWVDNRAVTIEVSNSAYSSDWPISDRVWATMIELMADICRRNNIPQLTFTGDLNGSLVFHYMTTATSCPGPYIKSRAQMICDQVNTKLNGSQSPASSGNPDTPTIPTTSDINKGDIVTINANATYWDGSSIPTWVKNCEWIVDQVEGNRVVLGYDTSKKYNIQSPINITNITKKNSTTTTSSTFSSYVKSVKAGTNVYKTPGESAVASVILSAGVYTIIQETKVNDVVYGKLKSGIGFIVISGTDPFAIKVGDTVMVLTNTQYNGNTFHVYENKYTVLQISDDRVVISADGKNVTAAVKLTNLRKYKSN